MPKGALEIDPRGLIEDAYRMALGPAECRTIFLDWAIGLAEAGPAEIATLLDVYASSNPDHPMTAVLREGLEPAAPTLPRRGGGPARRRRRGPVE